MTAFGLVTAFGYGVVILALAARLDAAALPDHWLSRASRGRAG